MRAILADGSQPDEVGVVVGSRLGRGQPLARDVEVDAFQRLGAVAVDDPRYSRHDALGRHAHDAQLEAPAALGILQAP